MTYAIELGYEKRRANGSAYVKAHKEKGQTGLSLAGARYLLKIDNSQHGVPNRTTDSAWKSAIAVRSPRGTFKMKKRIVPE